MAHLPYDSQKCPKWQTSVNHWGVTSANRWDCQRLNKKICCFLGENSLKKTKVIPPEDATMENFEQDGGCCNSKVGLGSNNHPIGVEHLVLGLKECENSLTLTTTTTGSKNSQKSTIRLTIRKEFCAPKGCLFTGSCYCLKSSARHTLSNNIS